jgi:acylglycerol lipase
MKCVVRIASSLSFLAMTVIISACSPQFQLVQEVPQSQAKLAPEVFVAADGTKLPLKKWLPAGKPKTVIVALHGFNDYSHAFESTGKFFAAHNIAVYAYDQRGFGGAPMTGIWPGEKNLTNDLKQMVSLLKKRYPRTPIYVLGESMGGAVAITAISHGDFPHIQGLILAAPAVWGDEAMNPLMRGSLWLWAHTMPGYKMTGEDLEILASDNIEMLNAMWFDKLVIKETRVDAVYGLVDLMGKAYDTVPNVRVPSLLLYGDKDEVIPREPITASAKKFSGPVKVIYYPAGYHMLLRDREGKKVTQDILEWINSTNGL